MYSTNCIKIEVSFQIQTYYFYKVNALQISTLQQNISVTLWNIKRETYFSIYVYQNYAERTKTAKPRINRRASKSQLKKTFVIVLQFIYTSKSSQTRVCIHYILCPAVYHRYNYYKRAIRKEVVVVYILYMYCR